MADLFDELVSELSEEAQANLKAMVRELADEVLAKGGVTMSAKELIISAVIAKDKYMNGYRWNSMNGVWQKRFSVQP